MRKLHITPELTLPAEAITETFGVLAMRSAGKSNAGRVMAEAFFDARLPFVVIDPVGSWWGLRAGRDGGEGLPIPIFGGRHGDVPLERGGGAVIADLVVDQRASCVVDLSDFEHEAPKKEFLLAFARRLYHRNTQPLHLFLEEADDYIPQTLRGGAGEKAVEPQLLRAMENLVRRGRSRGLGMTMITQRSASINKSVLSQVGTLIALRTTSPRDRAAIEEWVKYHGEREEILASLAGLGPGEAWVWSPVFLNKTVRVQFPLSRTFDSGATPTEIETKAPAATMADVDLGAIRQRMVETVERAKATDPKELQKRIGELERELREAKKAPAPPPPEPERVEVPVLTDEDKRRIEWAVDEVKRTASEVQRAETGIRNAAAAMGEAAEVLAAALGRQQAAAAALEWRPAAAPAAPAPPTRRPAAPASPAGPVGSVRARILGALAELELLGSRAPQRNLVAFLAGYSNTRSAGFAKALSGLSADGAVSYPDSKRVEMTDAGRAEAIYPAKPRSSAEVQARVIALLGGVAAKILQPLLDCYPSAMAREDLGAAAGYGNVRSAGFAKALSGLSALGFVRYPDRGTAAAAPVLFLEGA